MALSKNKLNEMYWTGYCDATIARASVTEEGARGANSRQVWMESHIPICEQCKLANIVKALEYEAAARMGPQAMMLFQTGGDVRHLPGFRKALDATMQIAMAQGIVDSGIYDWMVEQARKYGKDWPLLDQTEVKEPN